MRRFPKYIDEEYPKESDILAKLDTPQKIQDFLDRKIKINFEYKHPTLRSPLVVLREGEAHCVEGALLAAAALWYHDEPPLVVELMTTPRDFGHVIAIFKRHGRWGALSKTNHGVLQYRDPIYRDLRELAMSYFNEYFLNDGEKTMRSYSLPMSMLRFEDEWLVSMRNLWEVTDALDRVKHVKIFDKRAEKLLRRATPLEIKAGKIVQWKRKKDGSRGRSPGKSRRSIRAAP